MRAWAWGIVAAAGFGLMVGTYQRRMAVDPSAPWGSAMLAIGEGGAEAAPEGASALGTRVVLLPLSGTAAGFTQAMAADDPRAASRFAALVAPKLIGLPPGEFAALSPWLRSGRLPEADADEVLAGAEADEGDLTVGDRRFRVVGKLKPDVALFASSYLVPSDAKLDEAPAGPDVESLEATLLRAPDAKAGGAGLGERILAAYPRDRFQLVTPRLRPDGSTFLLYLSGQALFLLGGSGLLIALYRRLAERSTSTLFAPALREIAGRPRLIWGLHLAYFGLYVLGSLAAYGLPELNAYLMSIVSSELGSGGKGPLAVAGQAYRTGSIPYAAVVTFLVNFPLGSLAAITLPSLIVPGSGVLLSLFRASTWGLLLGPTESLLARRMIPHSGTLLLEGEGYILATFFALLVPIYLFGRGPVREVSRPPAEDDLAFGDAPAPAVPAPEQTPEPTGPQGFVRRYLGALAINVRGNALVAIVLAVAAVYEAYEVIRMAGF
ncbi:hypothetical protein [Paludisphaera soli]|uniref:hypothetical protein n=1 Tax=Paludisphaera soli TaxID=2712865 RepID=UPI0013EDB129|nr:hypothetical protein [Paludisphaera soli]